MALGEMAQCSQEERDAFYGDCDYHPTPTMNALGIPRVKWLFEENDKKPFKRLVDLCCNDSGMTRWLLNGPHIERLLGVDLNKPAIAGAKKLLGEVTFPEYAEYVCESVFSYDFGDEKFDTVVCFETIEHLPEDLARKLLRLTHRLLSPGGRAFMSTPCVEGVWGRSNPDPSHIFLLSEGEVKQLMREEVGHEVTVRKWADILHWGWTK